MRFAIGIAILMLTVSLWRRYYYLEKIMSPRTYKQEGIEVGFECGSLGLQDLFSQPWGFADSCSVSIHPCFPRCGPQTKSIGITGEHVTNVESTPCSRPSESEVYFFKMPTWFLCTWKFEKRWMAAAAAVCRISRGESTIIENKDSPTCSFGNQFWAGSRYVLLLNLMIVISPPPICRGEKVNKLYYLIFKQNFSSLLWSPVSLAC